MGRIKKDLSLLLNNQRGVALMMIMTAMILLMAIYGEFTFESKISRIKATNIMDRSQAKLLAESGLQLAMARLHLYKEAFNKVESNPDVKKQVPPQLLNQLWEVPFMLPIPLGKDATIALKDTVEKFQTDSLLDGSMKVTIQNISSRLNLNLLRYDMRKKEIDTNGNLNDKNDTGIIDAAPDAIESDVSVDQALYFLMRRLVEEKKEKNEDFAGRYSNLNYQELISNLRLYISDYQSLMSDPQASEAEANFQKIPLTPKYGPLSSSSELYAIPGWNDELIEMVQNEFSVYPTAQIDLNKMTANMLRILIPTITEEQVEEFFTYRDDPENPKTFTGIEDFQKWVVDVARIMSSTDFENRKNKFIEKGITFGSNPNLFKVMSEGTYNRSTYTLVAYVSMPTQEKPKVEKKPGESEADYQKRLVEANKTTQVFDPRIIEIQVN